MRYDIFEAFVDEMEKIGFRTLSRIPAVKNMIGIGGKGRVARARTFVNKKLDPVKGVAGSVAGLAATNKLMGGGQEQPQ